MKKYSEIIATIKANANRAQALEKEVSETAYRERNFPEIAAKAEQAAKLRLVNKILKDNARNAYIDDIMRDLLLTIEKYAGKQYGPKTKDAIKAEMVNLCGCAVYFSAGNYCGDEIHIMPLDKNGFSNTVFFGYNDLILETRSNGPRLLEKNKINVIEEDNLRLVNCAPYCISPEDQAEQIMKARREVLSAYEALEKAINAFNGLIPSKIEPVNSWHFFGRVDL